MRLKQFYLAGEKANDGSEHQPTEQAATWRRHFDSVSRLSFNLPLCYLFELLKCAGIASLFDYLNSHTKFSFITFSCETQIPLEFRPLESQFPRPPPLAPHHLNILNFSGSFHHPFAPFSWRKFFKKTEWNYFLTFQEFPTSFLGALKSLIDSFQYLHFARISLFVWRFVLLLAMFNLLYSRVLESETWVNLSRSLARF